MTFTTARPAWVRAALASCSRVSVVLSVMMVASRSAMDGSVARRPVSFSLSGRRAGHSPVGGSDARTTARGPVRSSSAAQPSMWGQIGSSDRSMPRPAFAAICMALTAWLRVSARPGSQVTSQPSPAGRAVCGAGRRGGEPVAVHDGWPATAAALCPGGGEPGHGPLVDEVAFQLGERGHHREEELALTGRAVGPGHFPRQDPHADPALMQAIRDDQDVLGGPAEPVKLPHAQGVPGPRVVERGGQARPVRLAGGNLLLEDPAAPGLGERVALQLGVLAI